MGKERFLYEEKVIKNINEFFYSIRDIKIYFLQNYFIVGFWNVLNGFALSLRKFLTFSVLPRLIIEVVLIFFLGALLILLTLKDDNFA